MYQIRPAHISDLPTLYHICLKTGLAGKDATGLVDDEILGHYFLAPYIVLEPDFCFTLTGENRPVGYIVGTPDTYTFENNCELKWWPVLRARYKKPEAADLSFTANMIRAIHERAPGDPIAERYPAHLHINMLPEAQGSGLGRQLIMRFVDKLTTANVTGLHFGVSKENTEALGFYQHIGFTVLKTTETTTIMGSRLEAFTG